MNLRRYFYLGHRWLGIALAWLMLLWFVSGMVMLYVGYPKLTPAERLAHLPTLAFAEVLPPEQILAAVPERPSSLRLTTLGTQVVYVLRVGKETQVFDARQGQLLGAPDAARWQQVAAAWAPGEPVQALGSVQEDAWTHSRALDPHRPLQLFAVGDDWLYLSGVTGEVVRDAPAFERQWGWLGAWLHWLYPLRGGRFEGVWHDTVVYASLAGTLLTLLGVWVGISRWRRRPYANGAHTPYREFWLRWHHLIGLASGLLILLWVFSGLMSMNPWRIFEGRKAPAAASLPALSALPEPGQWAGCPAAADAVEVLWQSVGGHPVAVLLSARGQAQAFGPAARSGTCPEATGVPGDWLRAEAERQGGAAPVALEILTAHDFYYYARGPHTMGGHQERPLPAVRYRFADAEENWVTLDPATGSVVHRSTRAKRWQRVLFALFHSWDWLPLLERRPLWDLAMIVGSLGGVVVSLSGLILGWRRLQRRRRGPPTAVSPECTTGS